MSGRSGFDVIVVIGTFGVRPLGFLVVVELVSLARARLFVMIAGGGGMAASDPDVVAGAPKRDAIDVV